MRIAALLPLLFGLAVPPLAPAGPQPAPAAEACTMPCCRETEGTGACVPKCACPVVCVPSVTQAAAVVPAASGFFAPASAVRRRAVPHDESGIVRALRPEVPPPRA